MATSPCASALPEMLSMVPEEANSDVERSQKRKQRRLYWMCTMQVEPLVPDFDLWAQVISSHHQW
jgi:hypothetical protein